MSKLYFSIFKLLLLERIYSTLISPNCLKTLAYSSKSLIISANSKLVTRPNKPGHYDKPKLLIPDILVSPRFTIDGEGEIYHGPAIHSIILNEDTELDLYYLLGVISSKVFWFFIANTSTALRGDAFRLTPMYVRQFPIKPLKGKKALYAQIKSLVEDLLEIKSKIESDLDPKVKNVLETQYSKKIEVLNQLVYELYGLKQEEIDVIESGNE